MKLDMTRKIILVTGLFLMGLVGLFPPWISNVDMLEENEVKPAYFEPGGRHFLFAPPKPMIAERRLVITRELDYPRLIVEWLVIGLLTGCALGFTGILAELESKPTRQSETLPKAA